MEYLQVKREIEAGKLAPVYFFFGEEAYFIDRLVAAVIEKGTDASGRDFNCDVLTGDSTDGSAVVALASSYPMMADRRVVVLKSVQKLAPSDKKRVQSYVENALESTSLVMTAGKVDRRQSFYSALSKHGRWVECKPLYENQAVDWVIKTVREKGTVISYDGASFLVRHVGTSLWALHNEIEKLLTFSWGKQRLGLEDVVAVAGFSRKFNLWELTDSVGKKELKKALAVLKQLLEEGQSPIGILMDLSRRVFLLLRIRSMLDDGVSRGEVEKALNLRSYFAKLYFGQASCFTKEELMDAPRLLMRMDNAIKTGRMDPVMAVTLAVHGLAGRAGRNAAPR